MSSKSFFLRTKKLWLWAEHQHLMPDDTVYVRIEGGDHHQFGAYIIEPDEHLATISRDSQHEQIVQATLDSSYALRLGQSASPLTVISI